MVPFLTVILAALWPLAMVVIAYRLASAIERFAPAISATSLSGMEDIAVPDDLMALALTQSESWAQEDTLKSMRERYAELRDWQKVRFAFGVGRIDQ